MAERQPDATRVPASVPRSDGVLVAVADLQVTHEELRVAEEELAEQREQLGELVARHDSGQRWRDHLFALLPVGVLVTDGEGKVLEANARAAGLLGVRLVHLPGTPLLVYVQTAHRRLVRELLAQFGQGQWELRATVTVTPRQGQPFPADLIALPDAEGAPGTLRWVILPEVDRAGTASFPAAAGKDESADHSLRIATALAQLLTVPADASDQQRLLGRIALVVGSAVPGATAVSVTIGDPARPDRLASDSAEAQAFDRLQVRLGEGPCVAPLGREPSPSKPCGSGGWSSGRSPRCCGTSASGPPCRRWSATWSGRWTPGP